MTATTLLGTRHFSYASAAEEFDLPERWLRNNISRLPHRKFGRYVRFSEADMHAISAQFAHTDPITAAANSAPVTAMPDIKPSSRRRNAA